MMTCLGAVRLAALFLTPVFFTLRAHCSDHAPEMKSDSSGYSTTAQISLPASGLLPTERTAIESLGDVANAIASNSDVVEIQGVARSALSEYWGDLSSTSLEIALVFSGGRDNHYVKRIAISSPHGEATFDYAADGGLKICALTLKREGRAELLKLGVELFPKGTLKTLTYANQQGELVRRIVQWQEDGSLIRSQTLDEPKKPNMTGNGLLAVPRLCDRRVAPTILRRCGRRWNIHCGRIIRATRVSALDRARSHVVTTSNNTIRIDVSHFSEVLVCELSY